MLAAATLLSALAGIHDDARAAEVARINAIPGLTWRAAVPERFRGAPVGASSTLLGVKPESKDVLAAHISAGSVKVVEASSGFVAAGTFDSAENWPQCAKVITDIRDQSNCGCCWAFAAAEAASDRLCISTNGSTQVPLSAQDMCFCGSSNGCGGGYVSAAWQTVQNQGLVTGSQQQPDDGKTDPFAGLGLCSSFSLPHCHHHGPTGSDPYPAEGAKGCASQSSAQCPTKCDSTAKSPHDDFMKDKWTFTGGVETYNSESSIQEAVQTHGPIEVAFTVYSDFENYAGGVYTKTSNQQLGGHAVKLVGWGVESGVKYWKIANSWNPYWGEKGYFRIRRGTNECGIESQTAANSGSGKWEQGVSPPPGPAPPSPGALKFSCQPVGTSKVCMIDPTGKLDQAACQAQCTAPAPGPPAPPPGPPGGAFKCTKMGPAGTKMCEPDAAGSKSLEECTKTCKH